MLHSVSSKETSSSGINSSISHISSARIERTNATILDRLFYECHKVKELQERGKKRRGAIAGRRKQFSPPQ